jgi:hypothetical protein
MLIRNVKSKHDLENRKKLQAELLQVQIDNEALSEQRVKDYKNPNKPPPVPPQYKSNSDMQKDSLIQQKQAIDNLRTLNLNYAVASQVSQDLTKLPDGIANLVKLNKNFPFIKGDIVKRLDPAYLDAQTIIEYLKEYFAEIDTSIGVNLAGSSSTNFFNSAPMSGAIILPSSETFESLKKIVEKIFQDFDLNPNEAKIIIDQAEGMGKITPSDDELSLIDMFPIIERQRLNKTIEKLIKVYKIPTNTFVEKIFIALDEISRTASGNSALSATQTSIPPTPELLQTLGVLKNTLGQIDNQSQEKLKEFKEEIQKEQNKIQQAQVGLSNPPPPPPSFPAPPSFPPPPAHATNTNITRKTIIADNIKHIQDKTNVLVNQTGRVRLSDPRSRFLYNERYFNHVATIDAEEPKADFSNVIFEKFKENKKTAPYKKLPKPVRMGNKSIGEPDFVEVDVNYLPFPLENFLLVARFDAYEKGIVAKGPDDNLLQPIDFRHDEDFYKKMVRNIEHPYYFQKLKDDDSYDPKHNPQDRLIPEQGFGLTNKVIKHFEKDNKEMIKLKKSYNKHLKTEKKADDESSSDEEKMGKGKMAFKGRRIKLGKGIAIQKDEPTYREFGKYVIHYPHLVNNNLLNVKYPSLGSIPAIKIVNVDDNFKDFMIDVLENGRVNQRHYNNLTEPEKTHFVKVARGAGLLGVLGISSNGDDQECKDIKRLELLLGEINAGNDNDKMIKECKTLIKKYVANGRINKNKGLEMLMELD